MPTHPSVPHSPMHPPTHLPTHLSLLHSSIHPSTHPCIHLFISTSIYLPTHPPSIQLLHPCIHSPIFPTIYSFNHPFVQLPKGRTPSSQLAICQSIHPSIHSLVWQMLGPQLNPVLRVDPDPVRVPDQDQTGPGQPRDGCQGSGRGCGVRGWRRDIGDWGA